MEDYKTKFEKLIQRIYDLTVKGCIDEKVGKAILKDFTPESEDERIRKSLINYIDYHGNAGDFTKQEFIAWVEKQGEQKPTDKVEPKFKVGDVVIWDGEEYTIEKVRENTYRVGGYDVPIYTQDEFTLKSPTKFKVGDWCIDNEDNTIFQITKVLSNLYYYRTNEGKEYSCTRYSIERDAHLWTIRDAKDGDVLANDHHILILKELGHTWASNGKPECLYAYCGIKPNGNFELEKENYCFCGILHIHPATKEQRDLLFSKMKEAGYEWDTEKKELKKFEQEEDERMINDIIEAIDKRYAVSDYKEMVTYLKALKERYAWKPSVEQMEALHKYAEQNNYDGSVLTSLYRELKKLKKE